MKPSNEIKDKMARKMVRDGKNPNDSIMTYYESAILDYLDEEYENKKAAENTKVPTGIMEV